MTVVAIWPESPNFLFAVADTRVSIDAGQGHIIRTDKASKLLPLSLVCRVLSNGSLDRPISASVTYGFAYAGDTLPALMTYTAVNAIFSNLLASEGVPPPSLEGLAECVRKVGENYLFEAMASRNGQGGTFEAAIFGWCLKSNSHRIFNVSPEKESQRPRMILHESSPSTEEDALVFGSGRTDLLNRIAALKEHGDEFRRTARLPKIAIENLVREQSNQAVGGSIQIGLARPGAFDLLQHVFPLVPGKPEAGITFLGFDLHEELGFVEGHMPGMSGLA
jgi:hypothetical protein